MASKKTNKDKQDKTLDANLELLAHKYANYYSEKRDDKEIAKGERIAIDEHNKQQEYFELYDIKRVFYPVYKSKIKYTYQKEQELHPVVLSLLKIIKKLEELKDMDNVKMLKEITQLDSAIFESIIAEYETAGFILRDGHRLKLSQNGKEALKKSKEVVVNDGIAYVISDGIFGDIGEITQKANDLCLDDKAKDGIELKPNGSKRPRIEELDKVFIDDENLTLRAALNSALGNFESQNKEKREIVEILEISPKKFFKNYVCLFYKNKNEEQKILAIDMEKLEPDSATNELLEKLIDTSNFNTTNDKLLKEVFDKVEVIETPNLEVGATIETIEHPKYLKYILENAKNSIHIQSPWISWKVLKNYTNNIENTLKREVKITIKYGLKPRNQFEKKPIDSESQKWLNDMDGKYKNLEIKQSNDHSKILICDCDFMIIGSFNWLSFGGNADKDGDVRGETSSINKNKNEIIKKIKEFNKV